MGPGRSRPSTVQSWLNLWAPSMGCMTPELTRRSWLALVAVCMGFFVIQLDVTIVNVALPAIGRVLGGSVGGLQCLVDAYPLPLAAVMLTAGSRADTGRRPPALPAGPGRVRRRVGRMPAARPAGGSPRGRDG